MENGSHSPGQYDGNFNVYVMSSEGDQPRQLTFYQGSPQQLNDRMGIHNQVVTWTPDSKRIVFLSRRDASNGWVKRQFTVSIDGGLPEPLPMDQGGLASFNADGTKVAYNRIFRNFRTWKRYTGGLAQDIYIYDIKNNVLRAADSAHRLHRYVSHVARQHGVLHVGPRRGASV